MRAWFVVPRPLVWGRVLRAGNGYVVLQGEPPLWRRGESRATFGPFVDLAHYQVELREKERSDLIEVQVEWAVTASPHRAAVSFAHLLDGKGQYVAGWDGLSAPATCWQAGDRLLQVYTIPIAADLIAGSCQIELGWYDAETLERWLCYVDGQLSGDRFLIERVDLCP
jgi:hypothetical protein